MKIIKFEDLDVWKLSLKLTKLIYDTSSTKEFSKDFELKNQIRRAIISVSSNIVEGFEKNNNNEFIRYLKIAKGSVGEVRNQLYISLTIKYLNRSEFDLLNRELESLSKQLGGFIYYLLRKRENKEFVNKK